MGLPPNPQIKLLKELIEVITEKFEQQFSLNQKLPPYLYFSTSMGEIIKVTILRDPQLIPYFKNPDRNHKDRKAHIKTRRGKKEPEFLIEFGKKIMIVPASRRPLRQPPLQDRGKKRQILLATPINEIKQLILSIRKSSISTQLE